MFDLVDLLIYDMSFLGLQEIKVIPFSWITHPFCMRIISAWLAHARARAPLELDRFSMKAELFREINGRFLLNELSNPHFLIHKFKRHGSIAINRDLNKS